LYGVIGIQTGLDQEPITDCIHTLYQEVYNIVDFASIIYVSVTLETNQIYHAEEVN